MNIKRVTSLVFLLALSRATCSLSAAAHDQTNAEHVKKPVSAQITPADGGEMYGDERTGNVEVTYADGTKDRWTTRGNCGQARVATDGTVGWTVYEAERKPPTVAYTVRNNFTLVLCRRGKIVAKIRSWLGFIEAWDFLARGKELALRTRALHGVALIERHDCATGRLLQSIEAYSTDLPAWAAPFADR